MEKLIFAKSLGLQTEEFWDMTPFELHIENQAFEMKFKREHIIELYILNSVVAYGGGESVNFDDILGYKQLKDLNFKTIKDFIINGKFNKKGYDEYIKEVVIPTKKREGL